MAVPMLYTEHGAPPKRIGLSHSSLAPYGVFQTADNVPILISIQNDREWVVFCAKVLGQPALGRDPRFASNSARLANRPETDALTQRCFGAHDVASLSRRLEDAEIAFARVNDIEAILRHPHLRRLTIDSPSGPIALPSPPARWMGEPDPAFGPLPALGEHTARVRREFCPSPSPHSSVGRGSG
jgi:formyl-CoA transferase